MTVVYNSEMFLKIAGKVFT